MDDQQSIASSVRDPFGFQRRSQNTLNPPEPTIAKENNSGYDRCYQRNAATSDKSDILSSRFERLSLNPSYIRSATVASKRSNNYKTQQQPSTQDNHDTNDEDNRNGQRFQSADKNGFILKPQQQRARPRWTEETLRTVTEDYGDSDEDYHDGRQHNYINNSIRINEAAEEELIHGQTISDDQYIRRSSILNTPSHSSRSPSTRATNGIRSTGIHANSTSKNLQYSYRASTESTGARSAVTSPTSNTFNNTPINVQGTRRQSPVVSTMHADSMKQRTSHESE